MMMEAVYGFDRRGSPKGRLGFFENGNKLLNSANTALQFG